MKFKTELQQLTEQALASHRTQEAIRELPKHYPALSAYKTTQDYRERLRLDHPAIVALSKAVQLSPYQIGALYLLVIGSGYRLQLAESISPDPASLLSLLWEGCIHSPGAPYRWVLRRCIEAYRSTLADRKRIERYTDDQAQQEGWTLGSEDCGKSNPEVDYKLREILEGAISTLTPRQKEALLLRLQGYSIAEIGERLGVEENAANQLLVKAREKLKNILG